MFMNRESLARCLVGVATPQREQYSYIAVKAVVKSTFVESKTSPSPKRFESESRPSPKRFESESRPSPKRFESESRPSPKSFESKSKSKSK